MIHECFDLYMRGTVAPPQWAVSSYQSYSAYWGQCRFHPDSCYKLTLMSNSIVFFSYLTLNFTCVLYFFYSWIWTTPVSICVVQWNLSFTTVEFYYHLICNDNLKHHYSKSRFGRPPKLSTKISRQVTVQNSDRKWQVLLYNLLHWNELPFFSYCN